MSSRKKAIKIFEAAVEAVHPGRLLHQYLHTNKTEIKIGAQVWQKKDVGKLIVIAVGKAAAGMALAAEEILEDSISHGLCITKHGHALPLQKLAVIEAGHPVPNGGSVEAAKQIHTLVKGLSADDIVLLLLSGGASSLIADIPTGCSLADLQQLNYLLVNSGASIAEINTVRKKISTLKAGQLAQAAAPATVVTMAISDVINDDPEIIGSGLTVPATGDYQSAVDILQQYGLWEKIPASVSDHLQKGINNLLLPLPKTGDEVFKRNAFYIIANNILALQAAKAAAEQFGFSSLIFKEKLADDVEKTAKLLTRLAKDYKGSLPACILMGGEPVLKVNGSGKGGRAQHFVLSALSQMSRNTIDGINNRFTILAAGTDGTDGPTDAAGAVADMDTIHLITATAIQPDDYLQRFDSFHFFEKTGGLLFTGPTQTNVCDIIILLVE